METALDQIAAGKKEGKAYLKGFWSQISPLFGETVLQAVLTQRSGAKRGRTPKRAKSKKTTAAVPVSPALGACPNCGQALVKRNGKHGDFIGCSGFPKCRFTKNIPYSQKTPCNP
jgi:hypothetical protein